MVTQNSSGLSCVDGLDRGVGTSGLQFSNEIKMHYGNPDTIFTSPVVSGIVLDVVNNELYMAKTATGSTWFRLISGT
jgi:hypothetical protein